HPQSAADGNAGWPTAEQECPGLALVAAPHHAPPVECWDSGVQWPCEDAQGAALGGSRFAPAADLLAQCQARKYGHNQHQLASRGFPVRVGLRSWCVSPAL